MASILHVDEERRIVVATTSGPFRREEIGDLVARARTEAVRLGYPILYDMRTAVPDGLGLADIFWMPRNMPVLKQEGASRRRIAAMFPADQDEMARFWETTFRNSGLDVRMFADIEAAYAWLAGGPGESGS